LFSSRILVNLIFSVSNAEIPPQPTGSQLTAVCFAPPAQSKALIPLQTEAHPETKQRVLTNYMFPQQPRGDEGKTPSAVPAKAGAGLVQIAEKKTTEGGRGRGCRCGSGGEHLLWHVKPAVRV